MAHRAGHTRDQSCTGGNRGGQPNVVEAQTRPGAQEAPRVLHKAVSTVSRIEKGRVAADVHLVKSAMDLYGVWEEELLSLAINAAKHGWWVQFGVRDKSGILGFETDACQELEINLQHI